MVEALSPNSSLTWDPALYFSIRLPNNRHLPLTSRWPTHGLTQTTNQTMYTIPSIILFIDKVPHCPPQIPSMPDVLRPAGQGQDVTPPSPSPAFEGCSCSWCSRNRDNGPPAPRIIDRQGTWFPGVRTIYPEVAPPCSDYDFSLQRAKQFHMQINT